MGTHGKYIAVIAFILAVSLPCFGYTVFTLLQQSETRAAQIDAFLEQRTKVFDGLITAILEPPDGYRLNSDKGIESNIRDKDNKRIREILKTRAWKNSRSIPVSFEVSGEKPWQPETELTHEERKQRRLECSESLEPLIAQCRQWLQKHDLESPAHHGNSQSMSYGIFVSDSTSFANANGTLRISMRFFRDSHRNEIKLELFIHEYFEPVVPIK